MLHGVCTTVYLFQSISSDFSQIPLEAVVCASTIIPQLKNSLITYLIAA